jgi:hypothetical protein
MDSPTLVPPGLSSQPATADDEVTDINHQALIDATKFDEPDSDANLILNPEDKSIKGATLPKLIERITDGKTDVKVIFDFLLTYRTYASPEVLLALLRKRFQHPRPEGLKGAALIQFTTEQTIIRLKYEHNPFLFIYLFILCHSSYTVVAGYRVVNVIKQWVERHYYDWVGEPRMYELFDQFFTQWEHHPYTNKMSEQMKKSVEKKREVIGDLKTRKRIFSAPPPPPQFPAESEIERFNLWTLTPLELARQMALMEWDLWESVKPWEFLNQAWTKKDKEIRSPNIVAIIRHFNYVASWVATEVVKPLTLKDRARTLARFIDVAYAAKEIGNYNSVMEIMSGLGNAGIFRLKAAWEEIPARSKQLHAEMKQLVSPDGSFRQFRESLKALNPPIIPYIGVYLTDLVFINDGSKNYLSGSNGAPTQLINFTKCQRVAQIIASIVQYQQTAYNFLNLEVAQDFLNRLEVWDDDSIYAHSLYVEPRTATGAQSSPSSPSTSSPGAASASVSTAASPPIGDRPKIKFLSGVGPRDPADFASDKLVIERYQVKAGTVSKLIHHLLFAERYESLLDVFLATYRTFTTAQRILKLFVTELQAAGASANGTAAAPAQTEPLLSPRAGSGTKEANYVPRTHQQLAYRILNIIVVWVLQNIHEIYQENSGSLIVDFLNLHIQVVFPAQTALVVKQLENELKRAALLPTRNPSITPPKPHLPQMSTGQPTLLDFHPEEIARQLALAGQDILFRINTTDMFACVKPPPSSPTTPNKSPVQSADSTPSPAPTSSTPSSLPSDAEQGKARTATRSTSLEARSPPGHVAINSPSVDRAMEHRALILEFLRMEMAGKNLKKKLQLAELLLQVIQYSLEFQDFWTVSEIYAGMMGVAFADVWFNASAKMMEAFQRFKDLFNRANNYETLRVRLACIQPMSPHIPPVGLFLDELQQVRNQPEMWQNTPHLLNVNKRFRLARIVNSIRAGQFIPYAFVSVSFVLEYIKDIGGFSTAGRERDHRRSATVSLGEAPAAGMRAGALGASIADSNFGWTSDLGKNTDALLNSRPFTRASDAGGTLRNGSGSRDSSPGLGRSNTITSRSEFDRSAALPFLADIKKGRHPKLKNASPKSASSAEDKSANSSSKSGKSKLKKVAGKKDKLKDKDKDKEKEKEKSKETKEKKKPRKPLSKKSKDKTSDKNTKAVQKPVSSTTEEAGLFVPSKPVPRRTKTRESLFPNTEKDSSFITSNASPRRASNADERTPSTSSSRYTTEGSGSDDEGGDSDSSTSLSSSVPESSSVLGADDSQ